MTKKNPIPWRNSGVVVFDKDRMHHIIEIYQPAIGHEAGTVSLFLTGGEKPYLWIGHNNSYVATFGGKRELTALARAILELKWTTKKKRKRVRREKSI